MNRTTLALLEKLIDAKLAAALAANPADHQAAVEAARAALLAGFEVMDDEGVEQ